MTPPQSEKPPWDEVCERFRGLVRGLLIRLGASRLVVFVLAALAGPMIVDWRLNLAGPARLALLLLFLVGVGVGVHWELRRHLWRPWSDAEVLRYLDSISPTGEDALLVLHELHHGDGVVEARSETGRDFLERAGAELDPALAQVRLPESVRPARVRHWEAAAAATVMVAVLVTILFTEHVGVGLARFFNPFTSLRWPRRTIIELVEPPSGWNVAQGESFTFEGTVGGEEVPEEVMLFSRPAAGGHWVSQRLPLTPAPEGRPGAQLRHTFLQVNAPLEFYLVGGDDRTSRITLAVIPAPELIKIVGTYRYPAYAGLPDRIIPGGDVRALEGTRVDLAFTCSVDLREASVQLNQDTPAAVRLASPRTFHFPLVLRSSGTYQVRLLDPRGLRELRPERYEIDVLPDEPPMAEITEPRQDLVATPQAALRLSLRATDDFGLAEVTFLHAIGAAKPTQLTDHITGPIPQTGTMSAQTFTWDLSKMGLQPPTRITYHVYARDVNPAGTGVGESGRYQIEVVRPSQFHRELFEQAKAILTEARLAYINQSQAYRAGLTWGEKGTGDQDDPLWATITDRQRRSARAAGRMKDLLQDLHRQIERNRMAKALCTGRLNVIGRLLEQVVTQHHPAVDTVLRDARPRTDDEAAPETLIGTRGKALQTAHDDQKMAALILARILRKLYDWSDLQNAYIQSTLLAERQDEITERTERIAPESIGKEIYDLTDAQVDRLLTLGNWQKAIYESETALEQELMYILRNAQERGRVWILAPMNEAFAGLRDAQVNEKMKESWLKIQNNQPFMITKLQREALVALEEVRAGLEVAGQLVEKDTPLTLAMDLRDEDLQLTAKRPEEEIDRPEEPPSEVEIRDILARLKLERTELAPGDALTLSISELVDLQEAVLARTRYLDANRSEAEMPRFIKLKLGRLGERQEFALAGADKAITLADEAKKPVPGTVLRGTRTEMQRVQSLITAAEVASPSQHMQADMTATLRDLLGMQARQNEVSQRSDEHAKSGGMDAFKRKYLLREGDLELAVAVAQACDHAHVLQNDVFRTARRLSTTPDTMPALVRRVEADNRAAAAARQKTVRTLIAEVGRRLVGFSEEIAPRVLERTPLTEVVDGLPGEAVARVERGALDQAFVDGLGREGEALRDVVRGLLFLMDEREEVKLAAKPPDVSRTSQPAVKPITEAEFLASITPEALTKALQESQLLPEPLRQRMIESLKFGLQPKYRRLLGAYYAAVAGRPKTVPEQGGEP